MLPLQAFYFRDFKNAFIPHILKEIYLDNVYLPYVVGRRDMTIVDIGANIGLTAYYFSQFAKKVYAIEPSEQHRACIEAMLKQNNITNVEVVPCAIAATTGQAKFYHNDNTTMFSLKDTVNKKDDYEAVDTLTMEDFMKKYKIDTVDLMKLDTEGSEMDIIASKGFENVKDKIKVILGEYHTWSGVNPAQFGNCLKDYGFDFKWMNKTEASLFVAEKV